MHLWLQRAGIDYIPPSPPSEQRKKRRDAWFKEHTTYTGRLMPIGGMVDGMRNKMDGLQLWRPSGTGLPQDATAYYKFSDLTDSSSHANNLSNAGVTFGSPFKLVEAAQFDGASFMAHADNASFDLSATNFTWITWMYPASIGVTMAAVAKGFNTGVGDVCYRLLNLSGTFRAILNPSAVASDAVGTMTANAWNFGVVTYNGTNLTAQLNNGTITSNASAAPQNTATFMCIGKLQNGSALWTGSMDTTALYKYVLSSTVIAGFWNGGNGADAY